jgi:sterol desaturase/sphingolipid hydroxylase (fatty acid hydroxylase superfamily)
MSGSVLRLQPRLITSPSGLLTLVLLAGFAAYLAAWFAPAGWLSPLSAQPPPSITVENVGGEAAAMEARAHRPHLTRVYDRIADWLDIEWSDNFDRKCMFFLAFLCILLAERVIPANRSQSPLSKGLVVDLGYAAFSAVFVDLFLPIYDKYLTFLYTHSFAFLEVGERIQMHWLVAAILVFVVTDFLEWLAHLIRHRVPFFWEFHAIHHSQEEMNAMTHYRIHPNDWLITAHIKVVPLLLLTRSVNIVAIYLFVTWLHPKIYHANLKTNFGLLRYVLVTPQSHRIHHSRLPEHIDTNFGATFSIWDHLFGTQFRDYDVYPETGIADAGYPSERECRLAALPRLFLYQQLCPILRVLRGGSSATGVLENR